MTTAVATPTTSAEELNGLLSSQTPSLISVSVVAEQLQAESESLRRFCQERGIFTAPLYDGGEYMMDFNSVTPEFIRDFTTASLVKTLEPVINQGVEAIASLRNGQGATSSTDTPSEPVGTETPTTSTKTTWKSAKKGKTIRETVVNLFVKNAPDGNPEFVRSMRSQDEAATSLIDRTVKSHYKSSPRSRASLLKEVEKFIGEMGQTQVAQSVEETPTETTRKKRTPPPRRSKKAAA